LELEEQLVLFVVGIQKFQEHHSHHLFNQQLAVEQAKIPMEQVQEEMEDLVDQEQALKKMEQLTILEQVMLEVILHQKETVAETLVAGPQRALAAEELEQQEETHQQDNQAFQEDLEEVEHLVQLQDHQ
jgi:hypothetical protein